MEGPPPTLTLVILRGHRQGETFEFRPGSAVRIGRVVRGNTLAIKDEGISTKHLLIESESGKWTVQDLDSSNGTKVNSSKLSPHRPSDLYDGDQIKIGELTSILVRIRIESRNQSPELRRSRRRRLSKVEAVELDARVTADAENVEPTVEDMATIRKARVSEQNVEQPVIRRIVTRSKKKELDCSTSECVELGSLPEMKRPPTRKGRRKLQQLPPEENPGLDVVKSKGTNDTKENSPGEDANKAVVEETEMVNGKPDSDQVPASKPDLDMEKMTARDWFDYIEIQFRQQTIEATEKIIDERRKIAERVRDYMIEQLRNKGIANVG